MNPTKIDSAAALGQLIRSQRKKHGLSQQEVADYSGGGRIFVVHLEQGKPSVHLEKTLAVLTTLGLDLHVRDREA